MLQLNHISKKYVVGEQETYALKDVSIGFPDNDFVAILGPSGSGKTTLLNIIGGLDRYDDGDLVIGGISTKEYTDKDWDAYRNHTVGFVFQSYNLIPHQTVLANVELALTISGASAAEKKQKATEVLTRVGLKDHLHKKPNQLSGGQMQRVAIARALVNDPDIILADEPTGALDSKTSVQIMDLLKEVAQDRLVIMVTHNPELAEEYATRIVHLKDGEIVSDTREYRPGKTEHRSARPKHTKLGFRAALGLSVNNLLTKKWRTFLTSFAASVGIIGIALILALSNGVDTYIKSIEANMLGNYPIQLRQESFDLESMMSQGDDAGGMFSSGSGSSSRNAPGKRSQENSEPSGKADSFHTNSVVAESLNQSEALIKSNDLKAFREYLEANRGKLKDDVTAIEYTYDLEPQVYRSDPNSGLIKVYPASLRMEKGKEAGDAMGFGDLSSGMMSGGLTSHWTELSTAKTLQEQQYTLKAGTWPVRYDEVALVLREDGTISDYALYTLGVLDIREMEKMVQDGKAGKEIREPTRSVRYTDVLGRQFQCFAPAQLYTASDGVYVDRSGDETYMAAHLKDGTTLTVTAVLQKKDTQGTYSGIAYPAALTEHLLDETAQTPVVQAQLNDHSRNVLTGKEFPLEESNSGIGSYLSGLLTVGTASGGENAPVADHSMYHPTAKDAFFPVAYAAETRQGNTLFSALLDYARRGLQNAMMDVFQNVLSEQQVQSMVQRYINNLSDAEKQKLVEQFTGGLSKEEIQQIAADYAGTMSEEDIRSMAEQYLANLTDADKEKLVQQYVGSMTQADMQKLVEQYVGSMSQADLQRLIGQYTAGMNQSQIEALIRQYVGQMDPSTMQKYLQDYLSKNQAQLLEQIKNSLGPEQLQAMIAQFSGEAPQSYDAVMKKLGYQEKDDPSGINLYPKNFESKEAVIRFLDDYNKGLPEGAQGVTYTDLIATVTKSITDVINTVSRMLIAFVAISLIVSSIMIAIITYISVLERTKEIGVLRALGSSKNDISKIFNAETFLEGLLSGVLGILVTLLVSIPINRFVERRYDVAHVASLPVQYALLLILISVLLTLLAGFIPARMAAKKDPVTALRTE